MSWYIGVDLGGTNIAAGLVDEQFRIAQRASVRTGAPRSAQSVCADMRALCVQLAETQGVPLDEVQWVGVGSPGIIWNGGIYYASNLGWDEAPMAELLHAATGRPVHVQNDANTAAYGEYLAGETRSEHSMLLMTIGTGIGSGLILGGRIYDGFNAAAFEMGHMTLYPNDRPCRCGRLGCFETYCSATGLVESTRRMMERQRRSKMWELCAGDLQNATARTAFDAMRLNDSAATGVVEQYISDMAIGVANVINMFQPEVFSIGGGVSKEGDTLLLPLRTKVEKLTFPGRGGLRTRLAIASLGNDAGIIGAAMLGRLAQ